MIVTGCTLHSLENKVLLYGVLMESTPPFDFLLKLHVYFRLIRLISYLNCEVYLTKSLDLRCCYPFRNLSLQSESSTVAIC
jgi:hypothetical protein